MRSSIHKVANWPEFSFFDQTNKQNKQTNKQNKQTNKQTKQTNKQI